jgi:SOS response regulatory protein OraA/RecX
VPEEAVLRLGLGPGRELDRTTLRRLRAELRRLEALTKATRALTRSDLSRSRLSRRLTAAGVAPAEAERALQTLERSRLIDDRRLARSRAAALAARGWGDAAIAERLQAEGIPPAEARAAVAALVPESERALALVSAGQDRRRSALVLIRRGFEPDSIEAALGPLDESD